MAIPWHLETPDVAVRKLCLGSWETNGYVVACPTTRAALVIDPGAEPDRLIAAVDGLDPVAVVATHGHHDHVDAAREVTDRLGVDFLLHPGDNDVTQVPADGPLETGPLVIGHLTVEIVHTPGHTPGSVSVLAPGVVLSGDTLFPGGPGATRGSTAAFAQILDSIEQTLWPLAADTLVMPGHGLDTTIGQERPQFELWRNRGW